jgi:tRNA(Ile)-lysidine synthase
MHASILTVTWPEEYDVHNANNFETHARARRYQALGRACRDHKITALMVAHHGDDQAETVMMRLANNRLRTGLKAMQSVEWIPECEGIYGVHHSGKLQKPDLSLDIPYPVEQGGIRILRPLLSVEKSRLIATCKENDVQWAEDKTNQEPTLASRNAIRHIYKNHKLPEALSIQSLVDTSLRMQKRLEAHRSYADMLFDECLMKLDIQTGALLIRFPPFTSLLPRPIETESDRNEAMDNAYCLIERVAELVTSKFKPALGQLAARINNIYPEFMTPQDKKEVESMMQGYSMDSFTVYHVWWRRWDKASPFDDHGLPSEDFSSTPPHPKEWLLTRQTLDDSEAKRLEIIVRPSQTLSLDSSASRSKETYQLFDGRFWIQLENYTYDTLTIRTFEKKDMRHLLTTQANRGAIKDMSGPIPERFIIAAFALIKPSDIRFTLPAVFRKDSTTDEETLIGFPTLNVRMNGCGGPPTDICKWRVRYKKVEFGRRSAGDIIVPGLKPKDIVAQEGRMRMANKGISKLKIRRNQVVGDSQDRFTGYKRVSEKSASMKDQRKRNLVYTQRVMEGDEIDGLSFLMDESEMLEDEAGKKGKGKSGRKYTPKSKDRSG